MPKWWLITWTTYGSWLPGDPRGFRTWRQREYIPPPRRYAALGEAVYNPADYSQRHRIAQKVADQPVSLTDNERQIVVECLVNEIDTIDVIPALVSVGHTHVHWLAQFSELPIRTTVGRIKSKATQQLNANGFVGKRPWSKNCHMESKAIDAEFRSAFRYIHNHIHEGCLVHIWPNFAEVIGDLLKP